MTREEALKRAKETIEDVPGGAGWWGRTWEAVGELLMTVERETGERCERLAAIHSQYPIEDAFDRGYAQACKEAAAKIRAEFGLEGK